MESVQHVKKNIQNETSGWQRSVAVLHMGRTVPKVNGCDNRDSDLRGWQFFMRSRALERHSPRKSIDSVTS
jgi:hypothetical protein